MASPTPKTPAALLEAENEATALRHLGEPHRDNRAVVQYELARRRVRVGEQLAQHAPRPVLVRGEASGEQSALCTLILARLLPDLTRTNGSPSGATDALRASACEARELLENGDG